MSITDAGVMNATMLIAQWQLGHASGSTASIPVVGSRCMCGWQLAREPCV